MKKQTHIANNLSEYINCSLWFEFIYFLYIFQTQGIKIRKSESRRITYEVCLFPKCHSLISSLNVFLIFHPQYFRCNRVTFESNKHNESFWNCGVRWDRRICPINNIDNKCISAVETLLNELNHIVELERTQRSTESTKRADSSIRFEREINESTYVFLIKWR